MNIPPQSIVSALPLIDLNQANSFINIIAGNSSKFIRAIKDRKVIHPQLEECERLNQQGFGIYFQINQLTENASKQTAANIEKVRAIFLDRDEPINDLETFLNKLPLKPSVVVNSSPKKYHFYWFVDEFPLSYFKPFQQHIATVFNGDSTVCDLSRIMRVPGFLHWKDKPFKSSIIGEMLDFDYFTNEIFEAFEFSPEKEKTITNRFKPCWTGCKNDVERIREILRSIEANSQTYQEWRNVAFSLATYFRENTEYGLSLFLEFSERDTKRYNKNQAVRLFNSSDPNGEMTIKTLYELSGLDGLQLQELSRKHSLGFSSVPNSDFNNKKISNNPLVLKSLRGKSAQLERFAMEDKFVLDDIAALGQFTVLSAPPNAGKTLITLKLLGHSISTNQIDPDKLYYLNCDDNGKGLLTKVKYAEKHGFHMLAAGHEDFKTDELIPSLNQFIQDRSAVGSIIILDTIKKFADLMNKTSISEFTKRIREFVLAGGTVIALSHVNKHKDSSGKHVYAGTSDLIDDSDCAYTITIKNDSNDFRTVEFKNTKSRGEIKKAKLFGYSIEDKVNYFDLLDSVKSLDDKVLDQINKEKSLKADSNVILNIQLAIKSGHSKKTDLIKHVHKLLKPQTSRKEIERVLTEYENIEWLVQIGDKNSKVYAVSQSPELSLTPPP